MVACIANPLAAVRTGALLAIEGTGAFGPASLALFRFTGGPRATAVVLATSVAFWLIVPAWLAVRRLRRADL
jgi:Cu-processing system permease protein